MSQDPISLADAAEELGVHYMTAYRYVRTGRMAAEKRSGKWWVAPSDLAAVAAEGTGRRSSPSGTSRAQLADPFTARLVAGDTAGCWDLITDALTSGATPVEIHDELIRVALERVGEGWRAGVYSVSDEHRATATAGRLLGQVGPMFRHRGRRRGTIIVGVLAGDPHALPSAMLADMLSDQRFEVIDLGANTPTDSFIDAAEGHDDLVGFGLCAVLDECVPSAVTQLTELRMRRPDDYVVIGGPAIANSGRPEFASLADVVSTSGREACDAFEHVLGQRAANRA